MYQQGREHAYCTEIGDERRTAVADKGEGKTDDGGNSRAHADIYKGLT